MEANLLTRRGQHLVKTCNNWVEGWLLSVPVGEPPQVVAWLNQLPKDITYRLLVPPQLEDVTHAWLSPPKTDKMSWRCH